MTMLSYFGHQHMYKTLKLWFLLIGNLHVFFSKNSVTETHLETT